MKRIGLACAVLGLLVVAAGRSQAGLIYDNLPTDTYRPLFGVAVGGADSPFGLITRTETFVAAASGTEADIKVAMWWVQGGSSTGDFTLTLMDSSSNVLDVLQGTAPANSGTVPVVEVFSTMSPFLTALQTYTLTASPGSATTYDGWEANSDTNQQGTSGFRVESAPLATPEPSTFVGAATAAAFGLGLRLRAAASGPRRERRSAGRTLRAEQSL